MARKSVREPLKITAEEFKLVRLTTFSYSAIFLMCL